MEQLQKAIIKTIAYYDIFDYPLTITEIWKWLFVDREAAGRFADITLVDVWQAVDRLVASGRLVQQRGYYHFPGREDCAKLRQQRYRLAERKYFRAIRVIRWLRYVPFIRMIGICNTLAYSNSRDEADIDLFIITEPGRIWQVRWWVAGLLKLFGLRPSSRQTKNTICPSFFVDTKHMDLQSLTIPNDIYLPYWVAQVYPVYDEGVYQSFVAANEWVRRQLPYWHKTAPVPRRMVSQPGILRRAIEAVASLLPEHLYRKMQMNIMPEDLRSMANHDSRVVITDYILKFHHNDRRTVFLKRWRQRVAEVL